MPVSPKNTSGLGAACLTCCEIEINADNTLLSCADNFMNFVMTANKEVWTGHTSWEVMEAATWFYGWMKIATHEMPIINGVATQTYGRAQIGSLIRFWEIDGSEFSQKFQRIERLLHSYVEEYMLKECGCTIDDLGVDCEPLAKVFGNIQHFNRIGKTGYSANLAEFEDGGICSNCYTTCDGTQYTFSK